MVLATTHDCYNGPCKLLVLLAAEVCFKSLNLTGMGTTSDNF